MTTAVLENLARSRAAMTEAAANLEHATQANTALLVRLSEAKARSDEAVRETKASGDPTGKYAMQLRLAIDDANDINSLLAQSQVAMNERSAALRDATTAAKLAETAARREETEIQAAELDVLIRELDAKLCEAMQRRMDCHNILHPSPFSTTSCFKFYQASPMLKNIVSHSNVA
jgi:hypothetical protein